ncbi:MAG: BTAD domain-containing putative transcriptional regulator, partial [Acidimicrobiia bacterium]
MGPAGSEADGDAAALRVRVLGGLAVDGLAEARLGSRKARTLLKRLVLARGAAVPASTLVDVLWGDAPPARPDDQLAVLVSRLRRVLGRARLPRSSAGYALQVDWLDLDELDALVGRADAALRDGRAGAARAAADAALRLARGPVLADDDADWIEADRVRADVLVGRAAGVVAAAALAAGDHTAAIVAAEAQLGRDPHD